MELARITLWLSFGVYLVFYLPQIIKNLRQRSVAGLSLGLHYLLLFGYMADLAYGWGREMEWQYRTVSVVGCLALWIQHWQIWLYRHQNPELLRGYGILSSVAIGTMAILSFGLAGDTWPSSAYIGAGWLSSVAWISYVLPQIWKNWRLRSVEGISSWFVGLALLSDGLDLVSAWGLGWDLPSLVSPIVLIGLKSILVWQFWRYKHKKVPQP